MGDVAVTICGNREEKKKKRKGIPKEGILGKRKRFREKSRESAEEGAPVVAKRAPDEKEKNQWTVTAFKGLT